MVFIGLTLEVLCSDLGPVVIKQRGSFSAGHEAVMISLYGTVVTVLKITDITGNFRLMGHFPIIPAMPQ